MPCYECIFEVDMKIPDLSYEIILNENQIKKRTLELGRQITIDYADSDLILIGVLKGSLLFFSDLIRSIHLPMVTDFITLSSYDGNMKSSGNVSVINDITLPVKGRDLLIVEDIIDTGTTSKFLIEYLMNKSPCSLKICSLLNKKNSRIPGYDIKIDYVGFDVPEKFLIGYGLDLNERYRNLPYVAAIKKEAEGN